MLAVQEALSPAVQEHYHLPYPSPDARACCPCVQWLLYVAPIYFSIARIPRRQDLELLDPYPFLSTRQALASLLKGERKIFALSYGWGSPQHPE